MKKLMIIFVMLLSINSNAYISYIPEEDSNDALKHINKCFKPNNLREHQVQKLIRIKRYKNGKYTFHKYKEKVNQIFLVTEEPFRPQNKVVWEFDGVGSISHPDILIKYRKSICI